MRPEKNHDPMHHKAEAFPKEDQTMSARAEALAS
jgi:hypothetical protein